MALRITVDVFSGRPNPSVVVTGAEERDLLDRLAPDRSAAADRRAASRLGPGAVPVLGYRGLIVETLADDAASGAARARRTRAAAAPVRVAHGALLGPGGPRALRDPTVESMLASPSGPLRAAGLEPRLLDHIAGEIEAARLRPAVAARARASVAAAGTDRCACAPLWDPGWWNDGGPIQSGNNCYNYAVDHRSDTFAQPGRANAAMYASMSAADVRTAALADALVDGPQRNRCPGKGHLVALCVSQWDFHWYRKQRSGNWTHKPGPDPVTQLDNASQPIPDPRTADRGPYTHFVGFMTVLHGHVKIG